MTEAEFDIHRWRKGEVVGCEGMEFNVHSVNFETGDVGIHNNDKHLVVNFKHINILS